MNQEIKWRWVEALRSDKYRQTTDALRRGERFCCLGVLCDLAVKDGIVTQYVDEYHHYYYADQDAVLPAKVIEWAGVPDSDPDVTCNGEATTLANLNDNGKSFAEIADLIEEQM